jgi:predicted phage baseplate assembly protein
MSDDNRLKPLVRGNDGCIWVHYGRWHMSNTVDALDACGCCQTGIPEPVTQNRPGLPALAYRIGTHGTFLKRMLARLPSQQIPDGPHAAERPLADLTTRSSDDPTIAVLDAAAVLMDVLAFYQERVANEGYLRTATERRSVLELARTIGYELSPGVAASTFLAFAVDTATGAPDTAIVPLGTKVQSIPGPGELPQTFETSAEITARVEWNALRPRLTRPQELAIRRNDSKLYLLGVSTRFGDVVSQPVGDMFALDVDLAAELPGVPEAQAVEIGQVFFSGTNTGLKPGDILLLVGKRSDQADPVTLVRSIGQVTAQPELNRTQVDFEVELTAEPPKPPSFTRQIYQIAQAKLELLDLTTTALKASVVRQSWRESDLSAYTAVQGWSRVKVAANVNYRPPPPPAPPLAPADPGAFAFRAQLAIFGHNAPYYPSLPTSTQGAFHPWDGTSELSIWKDSRKPAGQATPAYYAGADIYLERNVPGLPGDGWVVLERPINNYLVYRLRSATDSSLAGFAMSAKSVGLTLGKPDATGGTLSQNASDRPEEFKVRGTTAHVQSERLTLAELPIEDPMAAGSTELQLDQMVLGLQVGQPVAITGEREDLQGVTVSEVIILTDVLHSGGFTTLFFGSPGLKYAYVRKSVTLNANIARSTHGETVAEVLGGGDGAQPNQRFTLKKPPLTYTSGPSASGTKSSLEVRVDGVRWEEAPRLYGLDASDQRFITRMDDDGKTTVIFGDGATGARLPTGVENVTATYRSGVGVAGMVGAGKLTLLQSRPLGVRGVTNPTPATGAADPEARDAARGNAPLTVLTMERIVSLRDFEDFARAFAGIGKARGVALWRGETHWVHVTVASQATIGDDSDTAASPLASHQVDVTSELYANLVSAMEGASDPSQRFRVDTYQPVFFNLKAKIVRDARYRWTDVEAAVTAALQAALSFGRRAFAQPVTAAEVISVIQGVPGVVAVTLEQFYRLDKPEPDLGPILDAAPVRWDASDDTPQLAELLLINPLGIVLEEMQP